MEKFTSRQIISNNFTATTDGSCPHCGTPSEPMEQNVTLFPLRASTNQGRSKKIEDLIDENFGSNSPPFRKRCDTCQNDKILEEEKNFAKETRIISHLHQKEDSKIENVFE